MVTINWDVIKTAIGMTLFAIIFAVLLPIAVNETMAKNVNSTATNSPDNITNTQNEIVQLINKFKVTNITQNNCTTINAYSEQIKPFKRIDATIVWCGDHIYVIAVATTR